MEGWWDAIPVSMSVTLRTTTAPYAATATIRQAHTRFWTNFMIQLANA
jgi:hypothetical protein